MIDQIAMTDLDLLRDYADRADEAAFAELVRRHIGWVTSAARRLTMDPGSADDVAQAVFILLARKAKSLRRETVLSSWLFTVTRYAASSARRMEARRKEREREVAVMHSQLNASDELDWNQLSPMLDELVARLRSQDQRAILLRFYEQKSYSDIGAALSISEEAARKRVSRAVNALKERFAQRGVTAGAGALAIALSANLIPSASAALTASATSTALSAAQGGAASADTLTSIVMATQKMLTWTALKPIAAVLAAILFTSAAATAVMQLSSKPDDRAAAPSTAPGLLPGIAQGQQANLLDLQEKLAVRDLMISQEQKVQNLFVKFSTVSDQDTEHFIRGYEWAISSEKRYRKVSMPSAPVGSPIPDSYGVAIWDGKLLKAFDTRSKTGSVRDKYDPSDNRQPVASSPYAQLLGDLTYGTMPELFARVSADHWEAEWKIPGKQVIFRSRYISPSNEYEEEWTFDLDRGAVMTHHTTRFQRSPTAPVQTLADISVLDVREVKPGIWLPIKSQADYNIYHDGKIKQVNHEVITVKEARVNEPQIEEKFAFSFPEGSQYYDFVLDHNVDVRPK